MKVEEQVGQHHERDRDDVDDGRARFDEGQAVERRQHAGGDGEESHREQLPGEQVNQRNQRRAEERRHEPPAEGVEAEQFDPDGDDQLGQRRLGIEIVLAEQVLVRIVGEIELVENEG